MSSVVRLLSEHYAILCASLEWVKFVFDDIADHTQVGMLCCISDMFEDACAIWAMHDS